MSSSDEEEDYEERRLKNIRQNQELIAQLDLKGAADDLGMAPSAKDKGKGKGKGKDAGKARPVQPRKKADASKAKAKAPVPRRQSARLTHQHADANETPAEKKVRLAALNAKRKREDEEREEALELERAAKRARHHDLDLATLAEDELSPEEIAALKTLFEAPSATASSSRSPVKRERDTDTDKKDHDISALRKQLSPMVVRSRAKVTQDRVYAMAYHPEVTKDLVFVGDKHGQLGIWDALATPEEVKDEDDEDNDADDAEGGRYWRIQPHWPKTSKSSISCIKISPTDRRNVLTSAYDCTIRSTSFENNVSTEVFSLAGPSILINSFDIAPGGHEIWISDAQGGITHVDQREGGRGARRQVNAKEKIGCVSVNQKQPHLLVTSSNDRMVKIWDARKLALIPTFQGDDDESDGKHPLFEADHDTVQEFIKSSPGRGAILAQYEHGQSASSAYWDPSGRHILSTSYDNFLRVWNLDQWTATSKQTVRPLFTPNHKIAHSTQTGRWVTVLKAQWSPNPDIPPYFTVGNMNHSLNIYAHNGEILAKLADPTKITAVQAVTVSHPSIIARVASGNASGRCVLWGPRTD